MQFTPVCPILDTQYFLAATTAVLQKRSPQVLAIVIRVLPTLVKVFLNLVLQVKCRVICRNKSGWVSLVAIDGGIGDAGFS